MGLAELFEMRAHRQDLWERYNDGMTDGALAVLFTPAADGPSSLLGHRFTVTVNWVDSPSEKELAHLRSMAEDARKRFQRRLAERP